MAIAKPKLNWITKFSEIIYKKANFCMCKIFNSYILNYMNLRSMPVKGMDKTRRDSCGDHRNSFENIKDILSTLKKIDQG